MKKLLMGLTAIVATSFAVPAFADDAKPADAPKAEKKAKVKKDKPAGEKGDKKDAADAAATDKKSVWSRPIDDSAKNLIPAARPRRERR